MSESQEKVIAIIDQYPELQALCQEANSQNDHFCQRKAFLDKQFKALCDERNAAINVFTKELGLYLENNGLLPKDFKGHINIHTKKGCISIRPMTTLENSEEKLRLSANKLIDALLDL